MASRILRRISTLLQPRSLLTGEIIQPIVKRKLCNSYSSFSYCALRYISSLNKKATYENDIIRKSSPESVICHKDSALQSKLVSNCERTIIGRRSIFTSRLLLYPVSKSSPGVSHERKKKPPKSSVKEFAFKGSIKDHDMSIKLTKIRGLLQKGKVIEILVKYNPVKASEEDNAAYVSQVQKKLQDHLQDVSTKIHMDYSNKHTTKFTVLPIKAEDEKTKS